MSIIVEDGTGKSDAESYVSVAEFVLYHTNRGNSVAALPTADIEVLLRKATDYLTAQYRGKWLGYRSHSTQALDFPRTGIVVDEFITIESNQIPVELKNAQCELAARANNGALMQDETQKVKREKVDVIEVEYVESASVQTRYAQIDNLLSVLLSTTNSIQATVVRV